MSAWTIYWILKLDTIQAYFMVIGVFGSLMGVGLIVFAIVNFCIYNSWKDKDTDSYEHRESADAQFRYVTANKFLPIVFLAFFIFTAGMLIPTTSQMAAIIVAPKIINNEQVQKIPEKLLELGNKQVDKWIKDLEK